MRFRRVKDTCWQEGHTKNSNALLAVMYLHKPIKTVGNHFECACCEYNYPCLTVETIEKELGQ